MSWRLVVVLWLTVVATLSASVLASASGLIESSREFAIYRDFGDFKIPVSARVFFNADRIYEGPAKANDRELEKIVRLILNNYFTLVDSRESAEYMLRIRMDERTHYAIRNLERTPAKGFVVLAICSLPILKVEISCQNLTFYFFSHYARADILTKSIDMWFERILQQ